MAGVMERGEYEALKTSLAVKATAYTKPIRIYCDVDGVVFPEVHSLREMHERFPDSVEVETLPAVTGPGETIPLTRGWLAWDKEVVNRLAALSHNPDVDFVWLSSWRVSAPHTLDALLGIKSVGYLPWMNKMADYSHAFKKEALIEDQKESPSKFVWIDDHANIPWGGVPHVFAEENDGFDFSDYFEAGVGDEEDFPAEAYTELIPADRFLNIITRARVGLTGDELDRIEAWVAENTSAR